jgi:hypothetical protein
LSSHLEKLPRNIAANAELANQAGRQSGGIIDPLVFVMLGTVLICADYSTGANPLSWALVAVQKLVVWVVLALMPVTAAMTGEILTPTHIPMPVQTPHTRSS